MSESRYQGQIIAPPLSARMSTGAPALSFDIEAYRKFVADADLSPAQEKEYLETLWLIMVGFVDMGFDSHPAQLAMADESALASDSAHMLGCESHSKTNEKQGAAHIERSVRRTDS